MGLDMYLTASKYIGGYEHSDEAEKKIFEKTLEAIGFPENKIDRSSPNLTVGIVVGYWRKANAIHNWFVENCQGGIDECQKTYITRDQLLQLKTECENVLRHRDSGDEEKVANETLPPTKGFFFGSTDIDEWYWNDLEHTVAIIDKITGDQALSGYSIYYQASW